MKIIQFNWNSTDDKEWIYAKNIIEAIKHICYISAESFEEKFGDEEDVEIIEVPKEKWSEFNVRNTEYDANNPEDWEEMTFEEFVKGLPEGHSDYVAGTMHE